MTPPAGTGAAPGHFGEFLQGRLGPSGPLALVTLPCATLTARARFCPGGPFTLATGPAAPLPRPRALALLRALGLPPTGRLTLRWTMPPGGGAGASTAALTAAARALGEHDPDRLAALCLALESATDPLMFPAPATLLWAPRAGARLGHLPPPPALRVVGGFDGPPRRTDPADLRFADIADLLPRWTAAAAARELPTLAALATTSAQRNQSLRGGPPLDALRALAARTGALGLIAAHTGSARGLIFAPHTGAPDQAARSLAALGLTHILRFPLAGPEAPR